MLTISYQNMTKLKPIGGRVLIKPIPKESITKGGLFIPDSATGKPETGEVLSVGDLCVIIKEGDKVLFPANTGTEIDGNLILNEDNLLAIL